MPSRYPKQSMAHGPGSLDAPERLAALRSSNLFGTPPEEVLDRLARLAAREMDVPIAIVSLIDEHRQFLKTVVGLQEPWAPSQKATLAHVLGKLVVTQGGAVLVEDAGIDPRVRIMGAFDGAYAGVPLTTDEGHVLGAICVIDFRPRSWRRDDVITLHELAASILSESKRRSTRTRR
jgi:GAF domain-containing protein